MRPWPLLLIPALTLAAQTAKPGTGTVTGHVYCADTNAPARMASVQLETAKQAAERGSSEPSRYEGLPAGGIVKTGFDGSFAFTNIAPGAYYIVVSAERYLSPRADAADIDSAEPPPPAGQPPLAIPRVNVQADQTASVDVRIERGAAITGTVRFDDGSPAAGLNVFAMHKDQKGKWVGSIFSGVIIGGNTARTDDLGHFRLSGLRDRDYILAAQIERTDLLAVGPHASGLSGFTRSDTTIYSGDTPHIRDAVSFHVGPGEEHTGEDITIPLSKFHMVSGVITAAVDGHAISAANVQIVDADSKRTITSAEIARDGTFRIDSVPEGTYLLRVTNAEDTQVQDLATGGDHNFVFSRESATHRYADLEQSLKINGDIPNLVLSVLEPKRHAPGAQ